jgi:outer membrane protein assembly factor BamB
MLRLLLTAAALTAAPAAASPAEGEAWPAFRGDGSSRTAARDLPLEWSQDDNLRWTAELPGYGQSSPVVWGERVFTTAADGENKERLLVLCHRLGDGEQLWQREFDATQKVAVSDYVSRGAPTPAADADRLYAFFESGDLVALTHDGQDAWRRSLVTDYGLFQGNHGLGSSPALSDDAVIVLVAHSGPSYLAAFDKQTGKTLWKTDRPAATSWTSPVVTEVAGKPQVLVSSAGQVEGFDAKTGERLWWVTGLEGNTLPSPSALGGQAVIGSKDVSHNLLVALDGRGDVTGSGVAWTAEQATASYCSPLFLGDLVYFVNRAGVAFCLDAKTGEQRWAERLPGPCWASPIGAGERVYFFTREGATVVIEAGPNPEPKMLAENSLPTEGRVYGVAAVNGCFVIRTGNRLTCVGQAD